MKTKSLNVSLSQSRENDIKVSNPFTWVKVHALALKLRAKLPAILQDAFPIETVKSLKITLSLITLCIATILPLIVLLPAVAMAAYLSVSKDMKGGEK